MKLCHIVPSLERQHGGPSKSVRALAAALARGGDNVDLLATAPSSADEVAAEGEPRLSIRLFRREWPQRICPSSGLRRALRATESDIVHHHALWLRTLHYAHTQTRRSGARLVVSPRGMMSRWAWRHHAWRKRLSRGFVHPGALEAVDGWHATSAEEEKEIHALGFQQPVCVSPNGVDAPADNSLAQAVEHWHEVCPATAERPVALFYSRFHQKKRVIELIDAWLEHAPHDWLLLLVGIPESYTPETLERYVLKMSGGGRVAAFAGADHPPPYAVASLFLLPSHNENFGLVIAEAMAHGVPVLVTDTTPWRAVQQENLGWCVRWDDYGDALRAATALTAEQLRERGDRAKTWVLREYSWDKAAARLAAFYRMLQSGRK